MKLKESFITYKNNDNDIILMDSSAVFSGIAHLNRTAAFVVECLKTETTIDEIKDKMMAKYDANEDVIMSGLSSVIETLVRIKAINE